MTKTKIFSEYNNEFDSKYIIKKEFLVEGKELFLIKKMYQRIIIVIISFKNK